MARSVPSAPVGTVKIRFDTPYPGPPGDGPLRLAFVGRLAVFAPAALESDDERVRTLFVDHRRGGDPAETRAALDAFAPHAVVVFRPGAVAPGAFAGLRAPVLGVVTQPAEVPASDDADRVMALSPCRLPGAWRSMPTPVADRFFRPVRRVHGVPRMLFLGPPTAHRERYLLDVKHRFDCLHPVFGLNAGELERLLDAHHIAFNLDGEPGFADRVPLHLAAGHLLITEPLGPGYGLESGLDHLEVSHPEELLQAAATARAYPDAYHRMRVRGRQKAERLRASRVWPALVRDLLLDLRAFGTHRSAAA
jgi:hypothetical protein